jgi:ATP-binding cassette subfamily F protein 3
MRSKDVLKNALRAFDGTLIVVSHDREFLDGLVDKVYEFGQQQVREHLGGIYEFLERKKMESLRELECRTAPDSAPDSVPSPAAGLSYETRKEQSRTLRRLEKAIAEAEAKIAQLETSIARLESSLSTPEGALQTALYTTHDAMKQELDSVMEHWSALTVEWERTPKTAGPSS